MDTEKKQLRNTHQRQLVLDTVRQSKDHPVADTIYERARENDQTISKGTVYRNLNLLSELGEIRNLSMPLGPDHYDFNIDNHYHFICNKCFCVVDANIPYNEEFNSARADLPGYQTKWHRLVLVGLCPECAKQ